jgi:hypothetical protein
VHQGQLDLLSVEVPDLRGIGRYLGVELVGAGTVQGALSLSISRDGVQAAPLDCLTFAVKDLVVSGERILLPKGLCLRAPDEAPLLEWMADAGMRIQALAEAETLELPDYRLSGDGLSLTLSHDPMQSAPLVADLRLDALRSTDQPTLFAPLIVTAQAEREAGKPLILTGTAVDSSQLLLVEATGHHDPSIGAGRLDLRLRPMVLKEGGPKLAQLSPRYGGLLKAATGRLSGKARLDWDGKGFRSSGSLLLEEVAATMGPVAVAGVNGAIRLSSLAPPVIPDGQVLAVKLLDVGLPLTDGMVTFGYGRNGRLGVAGAEWRWAGGLLRAAPFSINPEAPQGTIELEAQGIDLGELLALVAVDGLAAKGRLSGRIPVRLAPDRVVLDGGVLEAVEPGTLRYDPAEPPSFLQGQEGSPTALLMGALTDFRYSELRATLDGEAGGELRVGLGILGSNPAFYDGYPVKLNLTVSGALDRILRQSLDAYRIPDAVRDRMTEFGRKDP